jgi:hypothetical protein
MKRSKRPRTESPRTGGAVGNDELSPMQKFKSLTRRLLNVSNKQLRKEMGRERDKNSGGKRG